MSNVVAIGGGDIAPAGVNQSLVAALEDVLGMAKSGQLQSYIGTGFTVDELRVTTWCDSHNDIYQMLGSLEWLKAEYINQHTEPK